ncbi:right-handed parallel beta-helix repeat-containing protein [Candidatus Micrarchaeota archaeon]|nr:right-handed parallel beta-helix repeat-containing protein [Candidatus Micrarchaeota archaeon]
MNFIKLGFLLVLSILIFGCVSALPLNSTTNTSTSPSIQSPSTPTIEPPTSPPNRPPNPSEPGIYYVSSQGSHSNSGTQVNPWKTLEFAFSQLKPGDTLYLLGEFNEQAILSNSGQINKPLRIIGIGNSNALGKAIIDGRNLNDNGFIIRPNVNYVELSNIRITNFQLGWAFSLYGNNSNLNLTNIETDGSDTGIHLTTGISGQLSDTGPVSNVFLDRVYSHNNAVGGFDCTPGPCTNITVTNSTFANNGIESNFGADGFAIEVGDDISLSNVRSVNNGGDGIDIGSRSPLFSQKSANVKVTNSNISGNKMNGLKLWNGGTVINDLIYSNGYAGLIFIYNGRYELVNSLVANNDSPAEPTGISLGKGVTLYSNYNSWFSRADEEIFTEIDQKSYANGERLGNNDKNSIYTEPLLDSRNGYRPLSGSSLINAGTSSFNGIGAPNFDFNGNPRTNNPRDIGPYETN